MLPGFVLSEKLGEKVRIEGSSFYIVISSIVIEPGIKLVSVPDTAIVTGIEATIITLIFFKLEMSFVRVFVYAHFNNFLSAFGEEIMKDVLFNTFVNGLVYSRSDYIVAPLKQKWNTLSRLYIVPLVLCCDHD